MKHDTPNMIDRTLINLRRSWNDLAGAARVRLTGTVRPELPEDDQERLKKQIEECLSGVGGEVSGRMRAAQLGETYLHLNQVGRERFLRLLAYDYGVDQTVLSEAVAYWSELGRQNVTDSATLLEAEAVLREALTPPRVRLLAQFNALPQGVKFLVDMRAELLPLARKDPVLQGLDDDFKALLASWFDVGFLERRTITWDAPASLLEKLARYEAVHAVKSWEDIKHRLASDRRCYAFFHPQMPNEPLIYVWVALVKGISDNVQTLLDINAPGGDPVDADTAIFYSISNAQKGLAGVGFGNFLIKRVMADLDRDFKKLKTFATLSPIPGFCAWLDDCIASAEDILLDSERDMLAGVLEREQVDDSALIELLKNNSWRKDTELSAQLRPILLRLCAHYLVEEKRGKHCRDPVAHFHLSNGAQMERINWLADTSNNGLRQSAGMMINYLYKANKIEDNHEAYTGDGKIMMSSAVKSLLKK